MDWFRISLLYLKTGHSNLIFVDRGFMVKADIQGPGQSILSAQCLKDGVQPLRGNMKREVNFSPLYS